MLVELKGNRLVFSAPEVHKNAVLEVEFIRTLRIPDDDRTYPLPPGLGSFPIRHVDDFSDKVPERWRKHGGVMLPMYQAEAMWLRFHAPQGFPFAVKVAAGKINAVTGERWQEGLGVDGEQDYLVVPGQPWLDGYATERGKIRQFVAMPLGSGYSAEEQLTGEAEFGGVQIQVYPLKAQFYTPPRPVVMRSSMSQMTKGMSYTADSFMDECVMENSVFASASRAVKNADMALGAGGQMHQEIFEDQRDVTQWDQEHTSRCFVHLANALLWRQVTGTEPPTVPLTATEYARHGYPWFEYYAADQTALPGSKVLQGVKSISQLGKEKGDVPLPENESVETPNVKPIYAPKLTPHQVREGVF